MSTPSTDHDALISHFVSVVSCPEEQAKFFLEANKWDLQSALGSFYEHGQGDNQQMSGNDPGATGGAAATTSASALAGSLGPFVSGTGVNAFGGGGSGGAATTSAAALGGSLGPFVSGTGVNAFGGGGSGSKPRDKPSRQQGGIATLRDLQNSGSSAEDDEDDEQDVPQNLFAGGHQSGMAVQNPGKKGTNPLIDNILKKAAEGGASPEAETEAARPQNFGGAGYRLSDSGSAQAVPPSAPAGQQERLQRVSRTLTFWRNGFSVDDGPLLRFDDPANRETLELIDQGKAPLHLLNVSMGQPVDLRVAKRQDEDYVAPKPTMKPFAGSGQRLGGLDSGVNTTTSAAPSSSQSSQPARAPVPELNVDASQPVTTLQIRLADGTRMVSKFNHTHTIGDVRNFVNASRSGEAGRPYVLQTTFPSKDLVENSLTLKDAGLLNAVIVQRLT